MIKINNNTEFSNLIENNRESLIIAKFGAIWCQPCKLLSSILESMEPMDGVIFAEIDVDSADEDFVVENNIRNVPTVLFYKNGLQIDRFTGMIGRESIINKINENKIK